MEDFLQLSFAQLNQLHFLRPEWLLLLVVLFAVWLLRKQFSQTTQWRSVLPGHLAPVLLADAGQQSAVKKGRILLIVWLLGTLALAGPTWQKIEKPVFQVKRASVILMDMSLSMRSTDIKPNRLTRARFKAMDLADAIGEGEVALVAYAGDAFTISPLTADPKNLTALIPSLTPEIMPELGSYPLLGLEQSAKLLEQAGYLKGDIFWFTDGIDDFDLEQLRSFAADTPYRINIMAFGTVSGAPIKLADGSLMKDGTGSIVIPKLTTQPLITIANMTSGLFVTTTANDRDIKTLAALTMEHKTEKQTDDDEPKLTGDDWHEFGPYLVLLILPFLAVKFRRGATLMALVCVGYISQPQVAFASNTPSNAQANTASQNNPQLVEQAEQAPPPPTPWYHKVFKRGDQVAQGHYDAENYAQAAVDFDDPKWKGAAAYKAKDFETALNYFSQDDSATGWYNRGNALANLGQLDEAIAAYDKVLAKRPQHEGALKNKALLEQLKQQQEQQNQQDGEQQDQQQQDGGQEQNSEQQQSSEGDNQSQSGEEQQNEQQNGEQSEAAEPSPQEESQSGEEQQAQQSQQNEQQTEDEQQGAQAAEQQESQDGEAGDETAQSQFTPLTPEQLAEQEQQQKIEQLLRKVSDDPATLLRNKMILENRKRQPNNRAPKGAKKSW